MRVPRLLLLIGLLFLLPIPSAQAQVRDVIDRIQSNPLLLLADRIRVSLNQQVIELSGRVRLATQDANVHADQVRVADNEIALDGRVKITTSGQDLFADHLSLNGLTLELRLENAFLRDAQRYATARLIRQTGEGVFVAEDIIYSNCPDCHQGRRLPGKFMCKRCNTPQRMNKSDCATHSWLFLANPFCACPIGNWSTQQLIVGADIYPPYSPVRCGGTGLQIGRFWALDNHQDITSWLTLHGDGAVESHGRYRWANDRAWFEAQGRLAGLITDSQAQNYFF